jgi:hypothetical protein
MFIIYEHQIFLNKNGEIMINRYPKEEILHEALEALRNNFFLLLEQRPEILFSGIVIMSNPQE